MILHQKLERFLPSQSIDSVVDFIIEEQVKVKISKSRKSKTGDYRSPQNGKGHCISINHELNKYEFLITLIHEFAHLKTHKKYRSFLRFRNIQPHGKEWKNEFQTMMRPFLYQTIFPDDILRSLKTYLLNPAASSCSDTDLQRALRKENPIDKTMLHLENIPDNTLFALRNGRVFRKIKKMRKNFHCLEIASNKLFSVSPVAEVQIVESNKIQLI